MAESALENDVLNELASGDPVEAHAKRAGARPVVSRGVSERRAMGVRKALNENVLARVSTICKGRQTPV